MYAQTGIYVCSNRDLTQSLQPKTQSVQKLCLLQCCCGIKSSANFPLNLNIIKIRRAKHNFLIFFSFAYYIIDNLGMGKNKTNNNKQTLPRVLFIPESVLVLSHSSSNSCFNESSENFESDPLRVQNERAALLHLRCLETD